MVVSVTAWEEAPPCTRFVIGQGKGDPWHSTSLRDVPPEVATYCGTCSHREDCLAQALTCPESFGIWAGLPPVVLRRLRQRVAMHRDPEAAVREGLRLADVIRKGQPVDRAGAWRPPA